MSRLESRPDPTKQEWDDMLWKKQAELKDNMSRLVYKSSVTGNDLQRVIYDLLEYLEFKIEHKVALDKCSGMASGNIYTCDLFRTKDEGLGRGIRTSS